MAVKTGVFINCPFDSDFAPGFRALVFAVVKCGFVARCAREMDDGSETRIDKLYRIIEQCHFGVHDLSRTELDEINHLPRFNMPLELGLFLGAKRFGDERQKKKRCLILDVEQFRFQKFISDLAGMDIAAHGTDPRVMARCTRNWLVTVSKRKSIPTEAGLLQSYDSFDAALPELAENAGTAVDTMLYADYERLVLAWVQREKLAESQP